MRKLVVVAVVLTALAAPAALACMAIGAGGLVPIQGEEALIVWDEATKTEHFVRRAYFKDAPADFGFLVPSSGKPELAEVPDAVFERLFQLYKAPEPTLRARGLQTNGPMPAVAAAPVQVIEQKTVAGLDATVLLASDAGALSKWLAAHKYPSSPALTAWVTPYVKRGAYVTAFKLAGGKAPASTTAVRMSFATAAPSFPYSEPPGDKTARPFRVSVLAPGRVDGKLGDKAWAARVVYAAPIDVDGTRALLDGVTPAAAQKAGWLTVFDEPKSVRGADDLTFSAAKKQARVAGSVSTKIAP